MTALHQKWKLLYYYVQQPCHDGQVVSLIEKKPQTLKENLYHV